MSRWRRTNPSRRMRSSPAMRVVRPRFPRESRPSAHALKLGHVEDAVRSRVTQHVRYFLGAQNRVDGDQRDPGKPGREFEKHPFRDVVGPHRDTVTGREPPEQSARRAFRVGEQLVVRPSASVRSVGRAGHKGNRIGCARHRLAEQPSDAEFENRYRIVRGPLRG